jgi:hypothetical protein
VGVLTHVALFSWRPGVTEEQVQALRDGLAALPGVIPEIQAYRFGTDAGLIEGNMDFAVVAEFADSDGYRAYAAHPAHRDLFDRLLRPILDGRAVAQVQS